MSPKQSAKVKGFSFGTCPFSRTSPARAAIGPATRILNVYLSFEEALKLNLAIDECLRKLNTYNRSTKFGKSSGLNIAIHLEQERITVNEQKV